MEKVKGKIVTGPGSALHRKAIARITPKQRAKTVKELSAKVRRHRQLDRRGKRNLQCFIQWLRECWDVAYFDKKLKYNTSDITDDKGRKQRPFRIDHRDMKEHFPAEAMQGYFDEGLTPLQAVECEMEGWE